MTASEELLDEICRHCNNYFNPKNAPADPERKYPASFLELAGRIAMFIEGVAERNNILNEKTPAASVTYNLEYATWQKNFARELAIWKRAKFI